MMTISHEKYLESQLSNRKKELAGLAEGFRLIVMEHNIKVEMIRGIINSIENQLRGKELAKAGDQCRPTPRDVDEKCRESVKLARDQHKSSDPVSISEEDK